jgi:hypothetical protein
MGNWRPLISDGLNMPYPICGSPERSIKSKGDLDSPTAGAVDSTITSP